MNMKDLEQQLLKEWAVKAFESLGEDKKKDLITTAIFNQLDRSDFKWNVQRIFDDYASSYANELIQNPDFQEKIKERVSQTMNYAMDAVFSKMAEKFVGEIKWAAERVEKKY